MPKGSGFVVLPIGDFSRQNSGRLLQNTLMMELKRYGYHVAEREEIQQVIEEQNLKVKNLNMHDLTEIDRIFAADYIITAAITDFEYSSVKRTLIFYTYEQIMYSVGITARVIDVTTGEVIWIGSLNKKAESFADASTAVSSAIITSIRRSGR